jgi:hypothetical protein
VFDSGHTCRDPLGHEPGSKLLLGAQAQEELPCLLPSQGHGLTCLEQAHAEHG